MEPGEIWDGPGDNYYPDQEDDDIWLRHYVYHTPAGPNPSCAECRELNWNQPGA